MATIHNPVSCTWTPLLDSEAAKPAVACLNEISSVLRAALETGYKRQVDPSKDIDVYYLAEGTSGIAVFFAYLQAAGFMPEAKTYASEYLNVAIEGLGAIAMLPSLYSGFTGIAWAVQHVAAVLGESCDDLSEIDAAVEKYLSNTPWRDDYDLITGLVGLGVYCLERSGSVAASRSLESIVRHLDQMAERSGDEVRWFTPPPMLIQKQREMFPTGYYNLGVAHGIPGVIALLGRIYAAGIARDQTLDLLEGSVRWLLRQRLPNTYNSCFTAFAVPGQAAEDCRLAWCYGDAGVAAALLLAARCTGNQSWEQAALDIAYHSARRDPEKCGVNDVCFCHGSAGLAHIFNRFYQATRDEVFADASRCWIQRSLDYRRPGSGAAGYTVWTADRAANLINAPRLGMLEGIAGVGLMLLAALTPVEPAWDRVFLIDAPAASRTE